MNTGFPTYGRSFELTASDSKAGVGAEAKGPGEKGKFLGEAGVLSYYEVREMKRIQGEKRGREEEKEKPKMQFQKKKKK